MTLLWLSKTEIFVKGLVLMSEHASAMIEKKKLAKKWKVFRMTDVCLVYATSSF